MVGRSSLTPDDERVFSGSYALCVSAVCSPCREMNFSSDSVVLSCAIEITSFIIYYHHDFDAHTHTHKCHIIRWMHMFGCCVVRCSSLNAHSTMNMNKIYGRKMI